MDRMKIAVVLAVAILAAALAPSSQAQSGRTLEELKAEAQARADRHAYPLAGLKPDDVREALGRLKSIAQSPPVHEYFSRERTYAALKNKEYLFDYVPAHMFTYGADTMEQLADAKEQLSLKARGLLDKPMAPMLVIGGALDTQVPIADIDVLLRAGDSPKEIWLHPKGGHMGRDRNAWPDPVIFKRVTTPWLLHALEVNPS